jgi:hypothetical protein
MKETAEAIDPDDSSKEMGRRHIELGILKREPYGPDLCVGSTPAWTAPLIFEPRCLTVLGPCAC